MGNFSEHYVPENELLKIAGFVCRYSPGNILLIGGGCVLSETAGYRRLRCTSDDLDFIVNDEGLSSVRNSLNIHKSEINGEKHDGCSTTHINEVLIGLFHGHIRGWRIPDELFCNPKSVHTSGGEVYVIPAELNVALKIRRGASKTDNPHVYGKDALDTASMYLGMINRMEKFDSDYLISNLLNGVCSDCNLSGHNACMHSLRRSESQVFDSDRLEYSRFMDECSSCVGKICRK